PLRFRKDRFESAADRLLEPRSLLQPFRPADDRRQRGVQLVGDAGDRLPESGHFFGLKQLMIDVARFIVELLALADVAHERLEPQAVIVGWRSRARRSPHPHPAAFWAGPR